MSAKERLVEATRELLWERGYESTSPRDILKRADAGQGSLYHHFSGKAALVGTALTEVEQEMRARAEAVFGSGAPPLERVKAYLRLPRDAMKGCRLGRLASEPATIEHGEIRVPLNSYFSYVQGELAAALREAQQQNRLAADASPDELAAALFAVVQGGYVIARASGNPEQMERAIDGSIALLDTATRR